MSAFNWKGKDYILEPHAKLGEIDLSFAPLTGINLNRARMNRANLNKADLSNACLSFSHLNYAEMRYTVLNGANLKGASLMGADLRGAFLEGVNLDGVCLWDCIGNSREIKSIHTTCYPITYTSRILQIGCQNHPIEEWWSFSDETISTMDYMALEWWYKNKDWLRHTLELNPALPT